LESVKELITIIFGLVFAAFLMLIQKNRAKRVVIYYHALKKKDTRQFEKQMAYLSIRCRVVKPSEVRTAQIDGRGNLVAITFDDAFMSILENAVPIIKKHGLTAGIFVPTGNLGQVPQWEIPANCSDKDETVMNREQIAKLSGDGFEIFSHTISHSLLTEIDEDRLRSELAGSKEELERIIGHEVVGISYPHGAHNTKVCNAAKRAGYKIGFTIEPQVVDNSGDSMRIGRFIVSPEDTLLKFRLKVYGAYQVIQYLQWLKRLFNRKLTVA